MAPTSRPVLAPLLRRTRLSVSTAPYYAYEDDCKVYYINTNGELTAGSAASITDDVNDQVWFKLTDGVVSTLYIKIVDETSVVTPATSGELTLNSVEYGTGQYTVKYQSTVALETADTYTVSIAKNGITIKSTDGHISSSQLLRIPKLLLI